VIRQFPVLENWLPCNPQPFGAVFLCRSSAVSSGPGWSRIRTFWNARRLAGALSLNTRIDALPDERGLREARKRHDLQGLLVEDMRPNT
jgi:hypothetical protein